MTETLTVPLGKPSTVAAQHGMRGERLRPAPQISNDELAARTTPPYQPEGVLDEIGIFLLNPDTEVPQFLHIRTKEEIQKDLLRHGRVAAGVLAASAVALAASHNLDSDSPTHSGPPIGATLRHNISQAYTSTSSEFAKDYHQFQQRTLNGVSTTANEIAQIFTPVDGQPHASYKHPAARKPNHKSPAAVLATRRDLCSSTGHIPGKTPRQIAMNYFVICEGESVAQAAGVVGNLTQESSLQSEEIENGGFSKNPYDAGKGGWGIAQWTPGYRALSESKKYHVKGPIYTLQTQLALVAAEMNGVSPTGQRDMAQKLKQAISTSTAARIFERDFEEGPIADLGGGQLSNRQEYAHAAARDYGVAALKAAHRFWGSKPSHQRHTGSSPAIYRAALKYNSASYAEIMAAGHFGAKQWHITFRTIGPEALVDCSGLVNLAEADAARKYGINPNDNTTTERTSKIWYRIPFSKAGQGDIMQPNKNHVAIIKQVSGDTIYTFAARTSKVPQPEQVGPSQYKRNSKEIFLRYGGPGAPLK